MFSYSPLQGSFYKSNVGKDEKKESNQATIDELQREIEKVMQEAEDSKQSKY